MSLLCVSALSLLSLGSSDVSAGDWVTCSDPPLSIEYSIPFYSGKVSCGNLLLESDIGGTHTWTPPTVTFPSASDDALYTVM